MQTSLCVRPDRFTFPVWKTLKLGKYQNHQELIEVMLANGQKVFDYSKEIMDMGFWVIKDQIEVKLHRATLADLGFTRGAYFNAIKERVGKLDYAICLPEIGPLLRINYREQPKTEKLYILMDPILNLEMFDLIFLLSGDYEGRQALSTYWWTGGYIFPPKTEWVFTSPLDFSHLLRKPYVSD